MKHLLLASASIVAFAGAASAEITFGGEAILGYNDEELYGEEGFYYEADLNVTLSQELDNGLTATGTFGLEITEDADAGSDDNVISTDYLLSLTAGEAGGLYFGDIEFSPISYWKAAGNMYADGFSEQDGDKVLRGDVNYGNIKASFSTPVEKDMTGQFGFAVAGDFGAYNAVLAYQEEADAAYTAYNASVVKNGDFNTQEVLGLSVGTTFAGATTRLSYATSTYLNGDEQSSLGLSASYPVGALTLNGNLVFEDGDISDAQGEDTFYGLSATYKTEQYSITGGYNTRLSTVPGTDGVDGRWNLEGSYNVQNGLVLKAGVLYRDSFGRVATTTAEGGEAYYVGAEYDLGKGAALTVSYADADETSTGYLGDDEVGAPAYQVGTTIELSFKF